MNGGKGEPDGKCRVNEIQKLQMIQLQQSLAVKSPLRSDCGWIALMVC